MTQHFLFSSRAAFGTWDAPDKAVEIISSGIGGQRERIDGRYTGAGRALRRRFRGAKAASGQLQCAFWPNSVGFLLASWMRDVAATQPDDVGSPTVYDHGFFFDDDLDLMSVCLQQQYTPTIGVNVLSAVINQLTLKAAKKDVAQLTFDVAAKDTARCGQNWDYNGTASPALISPTSLYPTFVRPFMFYDAEVIVGGTVSLDDIENKIEISGGTTYSQVENVEITVNANLDTDAFADTQDPTVQSLRPGNRDVAVKFDIDWAQAAAAFYDAWMAGTQAALQLNLVSGAIDGSYNYEAHVVVPLIDYSEAPVPDLSGDHARKVQNVAAVGLYEDTALTDFGLWLRTTDDDYTT